MVSDSLHELPRSVSQHAQHTHINHASNTPVDPLPNDICSFVNMHRHSLWSNWSLRMHRKPFQGVKMSNFHTHSRKLVTIIPKIAPVMYVESGVSETPEAKHNSLSPNSTQPCGQPWKGSRCKSFTMERQFGGKAKKQTLRGLCS